MTTRHTNRKPPSHFRPVRMVANVIRTAAMVPRYTVSRLRRRNPRLWVLGNARGFTDSPRYLAEVIAARHADLQPHWIARDAHEASAAQSAGVTASIRGTPEARAVQQRAGAAFLCIGINDLEPAHLGGSHVVMLYHGTPIKRVLLDAELHRLSGATLAARAAEGFHRWWLRRVFAEVDVFVAGGGLAATRYVTAFGCSPSAVRVLGSPRFDVIRRASDAARGPSSFRRSMGFDDEDHLVLWLPTWREHGDAGWLPRFDVAALGERLHDSRVRLVVKPHAHSERAVFADRLSAPPFVTLVSDGQVDVNQLLGEADALVTDYSSSVFDFAILDRPIHFFAPDVEDYDLNGRGLYEGYASLTGGQFHRSWDSLLPALDEAARTEASAGMATSRHVQAVAANHDAPGSSERIIESVRSALGLPAERLER